MKPKGRHLLALRGLLFVLLLSACDFSQSSRTTTTSSPSSSDTSSTSLTTSTTSLPSDYHDTSASFEGRSLSAGQTFEKIYSTSQTTWNAVSSLSVAEHSSYQVQGYTGDKENVPLSIGTNPFSIVVTALGGDSATYLLSLYRKHSYTVTFDSDGGTAISAVSVEEGTTLSYVPTPRKEGYLFMGWGHDFSQVITENISVKAVWKACSYGITLDLKGGSFTGESITSISVTYHDVYTLPDSVSRPGYDFGGWEDSEGLSWPLTGTYSIAGSTTLFARWTGKSYTITYHLDGGSNSANNPDVYQTSNTALPLFDASKEHYAFKGWTLTETGDPATEKISQIAAQSYGNIDLYAHYERSSYSLTYYNEDGTLLGTYWYVGGTDFVSPSLGGNPTKESTAQYSYAFKDFYDRANGKYLRSDYISGGITRAKIYEDHVFYAVYTESVRQYTIRFVDENGTELQSGQVAYGSTPSYSGTPRKEKDTNASYVFDTWSPQIKAVTADAVYTAQYITHSERYTINFYDSDGTLIQGNDTYFYNDTLTPPANPTKAGDAIYSSYTFAGWDKTVVTTVQSQASYWATYTPGSYVNYTVTFLNKDGTTLSTQTLHYGDMPSAPTPAFPKTATCVYVFTGWDKTVTSVEGNATYTALYDEHTEKYTVRFLDSKDNVLQSDELLYLEKPVYRGTLPEGDPIDTETANIFNTWSSDLSPVTAQIDYTPLFKVGPRPYTISFYDEDGTTLLHEQRVGYGSVPLYDGVTPSKTSTSTYSYLFKQWSPTLASVSGQASYSACYVETLLSSSIQFGNYQQSFVTGTSELYAAYSAGGSSSYFSYNSTNYYSATSTNSAYTSMDGTSIAGYPFRTNEWIYFFKVEPIVWDLVTSSDGVATLVSDKILTASNFSGQGGTTSYSLSTLHTNIATTFVDAAFTSAEKSKLIAQTITDSSNSSNDNYAYAPTSNQNRRKLTDYALFKGMTKNANGYGTYWLSQSGPYCVTDTGSTASCDTNHADFGVLPMITLDLPY